MASLSWWDDLFKVAKGSSVHKLKDEELLRSTVGFKHALENFPQPAENLRGFRQSQLAVPSDLLERAAVTSEIGGPERWASHNAAYDGIPAHLKYNLNASPGAPGEIEVVAPHEIGHLLQFSDLKDLPFRYKGSAQNLDRIRNYGDTIDAISKEPALAKRHKLNSDEKVYRHNPIETMSRGIEDWVPAGSPEFYSSFRKDFPNIVQDASDESIERFRGTFRDLHDIAKKTFGRYLSVPAVTGGGALAGAIGAQAVAPETGETASLPPAAVEFALKQLRKDRPGWKPTLEQTSEMMKGFTRDIPKILGTNSPLADAADLSILQEGLKRVDPVSFNADKFNSLRGTQSALPEEIFETKPKFGFMPPGSPATTRGNYSLTPGGSKINYNLAAGSSLAQTPAHEGTHLAITDPVFNSKFSKEQLGKISLTKALDDEYSGQMDRVKDIYPKTAEEFLSLPKADRDAIRLATSSYIKMPSEQIANSLGATYAKGVLARGEELMRLKDPEAYKNLVADAADKAARVVSETDSAAYRGAMAKSNARRLASPVGALGATLLPSHTNAAMSKNDITPGEGGAKELGKVASRFDSAAMDRLFGNVASGDPQAAALSPLTEAIASGIGSGVKWLGEAAWSGAKSLKKVMTQGQLPGDSLEGQDWNNAVTAASMFFNPAAKAAATGLEVGFDWSNPTEVGAESTREGKSIEQLSTSRTTPYQEREIPEVVKNVGLGLAGAAGIAVGLRSPLMKNQRGAINLEGFTSDLTNAFINKRVGKSLISDKMTGEQLRNTLQSAGIKEDELVFSGVGDALEAIGKNRIGPTKMEELRKIAEEGALGFSRKDSPGVYSNYSLFDEGDASFKNAVYSLPGVKFDESHFGEGVVAHRRFGDKELRPTKTPYRQLTDDFDAGRITEEEFQKRVVEKPNTLNALQLDEIQSQFYEQGSRFGHGEPKAPLPATEEMAAFEHAASSGPGRSLSVNNPLYGQIPDNKSDWVYSNYPNVVKDAEKYKAMAAEASSADRATPQGFAKGLQADAEQDRIFGQYLNRKDLSVENAPLRGDKYVELLAKDHLRDALKAGKDAISWTPSEVQHERYYGKGALGGVKWEFAPPRDISGFGHSKTGGTPQVKISLPNGKDVFLTEIASLDKNVGIAARKKLLEDLSSGKTSGELEGNAKDVYQKLYDRAVPKAFEKLTGEKAREGWVKGRNGEDVKVYWIPLEKVKGKMTTPASDTEFYTGETKALKDLVGSKSKAAAEARDTAAEAADYHYSWYDGLQSDTADRVSDVINTYIKPGDQDWRGLQNFLNMDETFDKDAQTVIRYKIREIRNKEAAKEIESKAAEYKKRLWEITPGVKPMPIAQHDQVAREFFNA